MNYYYHTAQGKAALCKGDDKPLKPIGQFKTEREALDVCKAHYLKACAAAVNFNRPVPRALYL